MTGALASTAPSAKLMSDPMRPFFGRVLDGISVVGTSGVDVGTVWPLYGH